MTFRDNLQEVQNRMARAAARAGRQPEEIRLVAVTKIFPYDVIVEAYDAGLRDFGENYVQEFEGKFPHVSQLEGVRFHLIGHLQSNKAAKAGEFFQVIQTVDSAKLAKRLDALGKPLDVMIEVKLSEEESKHGASPAEVGAVVEAVQSCANLKLLGLMTMPPWSEDAETARPYFVKLRELASKWNLPQLSMGMSNDLEVAIEEGSTDVRVGTALFGKRKK